MYEKNNQISLDFFFENMRFWYDQRDKLSGSKTTCLYIHNPFCVEHCGYCIYHPHSITAMKTEYKQFYYEQLPEQIERIAEEFKDITFDYLYFGGGTASLMPADVFRDIKNRIPNYDKISWKGSEMNPNFYSEAWLKEIEKDRFNYISIGIQSFNPDILALNGRKIFPIEKLRELVSRLKAFGAEVNVDLLTFIYSGDSEEIKSTGKDVVSLLENIPLDRIDLYPNYNWLNTLTDKDCISLVSEWSNMLADIAKGHENFNFFHDFDPGNISTKQADHIFEKNTFKGQRYCSSGLRYVDHIKDQFTLAVGAFGDAKVYSYAYDKFGAVSLYDENMPYKMRIIQRR